MKYVGIGDGTVTLIQPLSYYDQQSGVVIRVPSGFNSDLASVPQVLQSLAPKFGLTDRAAIIHDWLYRHGGQPSEHSTMRLGRAACDRIFLDVMAADGVPMLLRWRMWFGVRVAGASSFQRR